MGTGIGIGISPFLQKGSAGDPAASVSNILTELGFNLLKEDGGYIIME